MIGDNIDTSKVFLSAIFKSAFMDFISTGGKYSQPGKFSSAVKEARIRAEEVEKAKKIEEDKKAASAQSSWVRSLLG